VLAFVRPTGRVWRVLVSVKVSAEVEELEQEMEFVPVP
jgi:hypothetical protein